MEVIARGRFIRIAPRKARLVADLIRGRPVDKALSQLSFVPKAASAILKKILDAGVANATDKGDIDVDTLYIKRIFVEQGPTWKRFMPRAMGRATPIHKKTSHITVVLDEK